MRIQQSVAEVSCEERDRSQRLHVIDRASVAITAARVLLKDANSNSVFVLIKTHYRKMVLTINKKKH
jgi:hypothetical protein